MHWKILFVATLLTAFVGTTAWPQEETRQGALQEQLPENFPVPAGTVAVEQPDDTKLVYEVSDQSAEELIDFFRRELPKNGFRIVGENPPRATEAPVTLIVRTEEGEMKGVQILVDEDGLVRFTVS